MIDFSEYGNIVFHEPYKDTEYDILEFRPFGGANTRRGRENLAEMIRLLDVGLAERGQERGIVMHRSSKYPVPCCIIHPREPEN